MIIAHLAAGDLIRATELFDGDEDLRVWMRQWLGIRPAFCGLHMMGFIEWKLRRLDSSAQDYQRAIELLEPVGFRPELAWVTFELSEVLRERHQPGDDDRSSALSDRALATARDLGMRPLIEKIVSRKKILKA